MKTRPVILNSIVALIAVTLSSEAFAHDLTPPPWRDLSNPLSTLAEWDFNTPQNPITPDGNVPLIVGNGLGGNPPTAIMTNMTWDPNLGGSWFTPNGTGIMELTIPDWIDFEPLKRIRVQITYQVPPGVVTGIPSIASVVGQDNVVGPVVGVPGNSAVMPIGPVPSHDFHWWQDWTIQPNPDFERISIVIPPQMYVDQIVVDTISTSIPEPSSIALVGLGLVGLGIAAMRKRK